MSEEQKAMSDSILYSGELNFKENSFSSLLHII